LVICYSILSFHDGYSPGFRFCIGFLNSQ